MIYANDFAALTDSDTLDAAIANRDGDGVIVISPRKSDIEPERDFWLIDRAILIPENTTVILRNCKIKLSDKCRDNFFRTANCGFGFPYPERIRNVHLRGEGIAVLEGADYPRATGDSSKRLACPCPFEDEDLCRLADWIPEERRTPEKLSFWDRHDHSYGTDALVETESQYGDWRGIGVLFANAEYFSIENLKIVESHGWGISLEACAFGNVRNIIFDARMSKRIDGMLNNMENQDGVDIRNGCHHIVIENISGETGDDMVALTAIVPDEPEFKEGGSLCSTHVMHSDWSKRERDIHDIVIRNITGYSYLCFLLRLLPANTRIWNIVIDGLVDTTREIGHRHGGTVLLGDGGGYGRNLEDSMSSITISNVICNSNRAIVIEGYIKDSAISNVINNNPDCETIYVARENGAKNLKLSNIVTASKE